MATLSAEQRETESWQGEINRTHKAIGSEAPTRNQAGGLLAQLTRTIESEIIPRLLLVNSTLPQMCEERTIDADEATDKVEHLAFAAAQNGLAQAHEIVASRRASGASLASVLLDLLAPAARRLGTAWENDELSFAEVSIGLGVLQQLLRELSSSFETRTSVKPSNYSALLLTAKGEQHAFGLFIVESFFRRAGWNVTTHALVPYEAALKAIRRDWIDVVAISKSCDGLLDELASDITAFRRASRNRNLTVMVGGPAFGRHPEHVTVVGADTTASDGERAVRQATICMTAKRKRRQV